MSDPARIYVIDRFEDRVAVMVPDAMDLPNENVSRSRLPRSAAEGDVLRVPLSSAGCPNWDSATLDPELRQRRMEAARRRFDRLKKRHPGGDIAL